MVWSPSRVSRTTRQRCCSLPAASLMDVGNTLLVSLRASLPACSLWMTSRPLRLCQPPDERAEPALGYAQMPGSTAKASCAACTTCANSSRRQARLITATSARASSSSTWLEARAAGAQDVAQHRRVHTIAEGVTTTPAKAATYQVMLDIMRDVGIQGHISARASIRITSTCSWGQPGYYFPHLDPSPLSPFATFACQTPPQRPKGRRTKLDNRVP